MSDEPTRRTWTSQGLTLSYLDWGNPSAPLLILLHGIADLARAWDNAALALRHDFHVIVPDLRGHGDSQHSPDGAYLTPYHVLDFVDLMETLGAERVTLVAHSFGGAIAVRYAALYPERAAKIAIVDGLGPAPKFVAKWDAEGPLPRTRDWIEKRRALATQTQKPIASIEDAAQRLMRDRPRLTNELATHLARHALRREGEGYVWKRDPRVNIFTPEDFAQENAIVRAAVNAPVLLFWGPESWTTHPEEDGRASAFRDHRTVMFKEAGHWLHHDQPEAFMNEVRAFLAP